MRIFKGYCKYVRMKYPIGIQTFERIITEGFVYVDKTALVHKLVQNGTVYFLSRPRRFGKSLLVSTLKSYFLGKRELFRGLAMERMESEWAVHPVFHLSFSSGSFMQGDELKNVLETFVADAEKEYGKSDTATTLSMRFLKVIEAARKKTGHKVVVLIDEYDKPLLDVLDSDLSVEINGQKISLEDYNHGLLKEIYSVFKDADENLRFVLLTGVTKFSPVSVFSGFNQPKDISMDARYDALCGITEEELTSYFAEPIKELAGRNGVSEKEMLGQLKRQYDGYHFSEGMTDIFNPFSLLNCFDSKKIRDYWFSTGTPTYLMRLLQHSDENINELVSKYYTAGEFIDYRADTETPLPMIYQSGYLTIKDYDPTFGTYLLDFPNNEVRGGFLTALSSGYFKAKMNISWVRIVNIALAQGDTEGFMRNVTSLLANVSYRFQRKSDAMECERYFQYTFYLILQMIGIYNTCIEKETSEGHIDCIIECPKHVYVFEFKLNGSAENAMKQINERGYATPYLTDARHVHKVGVNFSSAKGTIDNWQEE
ncbi:MAG: AAA family ATPase [Bacteroidales bacterium]|nr:AAA family ATPase [Bacteroidales bacterium]